MNKDKAREILLLYRPGMGDEEDPEIAAALELAKADLELGAWFREQIAFHAAVGASLRQVEPPVGLKDRILAGQSGRNIIRVWWRNPAALAAAAVLVLLIGLTAFWFSPRGENNNFAAFRTRMARVALRDYNRMDLVSSDPKEIRKYLAGHSPNGDFVLPAGLKEVTPLGCAALRWHDRPVSMICFKRGANDLIWLFIVNRASVLDSPGATSPEVQALGKFMTASWTIGEKTYVLGVIGDEKELRRYL
jgi:hypothetical protein